MAPIAALDVEKADQHGTESPVGLAWWQATISLVIVVIGIGIMALPQLPVKGGYVLSTLFIYVCCLAVTESGMAMWRGIMANNAKSGTQSQGEKQNQSGWIASYEDLGRAGFGQLGELAVLIVQVLYFTGVAAGFAILIAESLSHLSAGWIQPKQWLLMILPVLAVLSLLPNVQAIVKMVPVAIFALICFCFLIVLKALLDAHGWASWPLQDRADLHRIWPESSLGMGVVVSTLFGAFGVNGNVPSILCEMKEPMQFPLAFRTAMLIVAIIYTTVMGCAYYAYGDFIQDDLIKSLTSFPADAQEAFDLPFKNWTGPKNAALADLFSALLLIKLLVALPLNLVVIFQSFQTFVFTAKWVPIGSLANMIMRVSFVTLAVLIAYAINDFPELFALVASVLGPLMQSVFPLALSFQVRRMNGAKPSSWLGRLFHVCIGALALFSVTVGFYESAKDVIYAK